MEWRTPAVARAVRRVVVLLVIGLVLGFLDYGIHLACWPRGIAYRDLRVFWYFSETSVSVSPTGEQVRHVINNAGAAHRGLHYVWVLHQHDSYKPWRVLVAGWSFYEDAISAIQWKDGKTFEIRLSDSRSGDSWRVRTVTIR